MTHRGELGTWNIGKCGITMSDGNGLAHDVGIIERGVPQAYVCTGVKRNAMFGARFQALSVYFLYIKRGI